MNDGEMVCQACGFEDLEKVLDLGFQPLCNEFRPATQASGPQIFYPLSLCHCPKCALVQLDYIIPTGIAFGEQYTYLTGTSRSLVEYFSKLAGELVDRFGLQPGDVVLEIGSNDGTFLAAFKSLGMVVLGVEGAEQPAAIAKERGVPTIGRFFGTGSVNAVREQLPPGKGVRLVLGMNVLAHTDNISEFLPLVVELMEEDSVFVSQSHWLTALIRKFEFDTVYHEHLRYYTLESLTNLFKQHGLNILDAEIKDFYGGSVLVYASKGPGATSPGLDKVKEQEKKIDVAQSLKDMKLVLLENKAQMLNLLVDLKKQGKRVIGVGAPMKASTLLNFYGITPDLVEYLAEVNELKIGTVVPGVRIPVISEDEVFLDPPDYAILLSWNMADAIIAKYRESGYKGKFILPVPRVEVI